MRHRDLRHTPTAKISIRPIFKQALPKPRIQCPRDGTSIALQRAMNTEDAVLLSAMRRAPRGEPVVRPVHLQRLSIEAREALDDMIINLEHRLAPLGLDREWIRRDVFHLLSIERSGV